MNEDDTAEHWLPVVGFEGFYSISDQGRLRSEPRIIVRRNGPRVRYQGRMMKTPPDRHGYLRATLSRSGSARSTTVHILVLEAFRGQRPSDFHGCHNNGIPGDCRLENLRWDTVSSNMLDTVRHGRNAARNRLTCPQGHALVAENLVAEAARKGYRSCHSCNRASAYIAGQVRAGQEPADFKTLADTYYQQFMTGTAVVAHADRERCPRGHLLVEPNLVRSQLRNGYRSCLSCHRAHARRSGARKRGEHVPSLQSTADKYYAALIPDDAPRKAG